jgi:DNA-binding XRE family transcriptional regulator
MHLVSNLSSFPYKIIKTKVLVYYYALYDIIVLFLVKEGLKVQSSAPKVQDPGSYIAGAIKKRRAQLDITQEALAQISGASLRSIKALEKGTGNPTLNQLTKVLEVLGWNLELKERGV